MAMPDSQRYPLTFYRIIYEEDIVIFLGLNMFNSDNELLCFPEEKCAFEEENL